MSFTVDNADLPITDDGLDQEKLSEIKDRLWEESLESLEKTINKKARLQYIIEKRIEDRKAKGLKINKITTYELRLVLEYWLKDTSKPVSNAFTYVYNNTGKQHKEVDWVKNIARKKNYSKELINAIESSKMRTLVSLVASDGWEGYKRDLLRSTEELTTKIRGVDKMNERERLLLERDEVIAKLKEELIEYKKVTSWQYKAEELLKEGLSQAKVAQQLGKSPTTIKRLVKKLKESGKL